MYYIKMSFVESTLQDFLTHHSFSLCVALTVNTSHTLPFPSVTFSRHTHYFSLLSMVQKLQIQLATGYKLYTKNIGNDRAYTFIAIDSKTINLVHRTEHVTDEGL